MLDPARLEAKARGELERLGVLRAPNDVAFAKAQVLTSGFPLATARNVAAMDRIRDGVSEKGLRNLTLLGILAERDLFFQRDVAKHVYSSLSTT
jgi:hypothetical protein